MRFLSVCSGIESALVAWKPLRWSAAAFSEIASFPCAVLKHHYPDVPNLGDMNTYREWNIGAIDLLVGGTPCQSFSVAGFRTGLADPRGNLALVFLGIADRLRPRWLVFENVPGLLSSDKGEAFGSFLGGLAECGYGFAYRVLDAQHFGVPQRRRRVFVVGHLGDWRRAAAVLLERESMSGNTPTGRTTREDVAASLISGSHPSSNSPGRRRKDDTNIVARCDTSGDGRRYDGESDNFVAHTLRASGFDASEDGTGRGTPIIPIDMRQASRGATMTNNRVEGSSGGSPGTGIGKAGDPCPAIAFQERGRDGDRSCETSVELAYSLNSPQGGGRRQEMNIATGMAIRRLTPRETERLQGFPEIQRTIKVLVCQTEDEKNGRALSAKRASAPPSLDLSAPVAVDVLIDLERQQAQLRSAGKPPWSASIAELASQCRQPIAPGAFARLLALTHEGAAPSVQRGRGASLANTNPSTHPLNGSASVLLCGREIDALASDAAQFTSALNECLKFTTSQLGQPHQASDSMWETLVSCVSTVISGFIPETMRSACSYEISLTTHQGYTFVAYRGKPAADGPRYAAIGNSIATPVLTWIGKRIEAVEAVIA